MKRNLLKIGACLLLVATIGACSSDPAIDLTNTATPERENRATAWDGVIGEDKGGNVFEITADKQAILADLQNTIYKEGGSTQLQTLEIVKKIALNDSSNTGYMLIAGDRAGVSIAVMLTRGATGLLKLDDAFGNPKTTSCRGCATGCNLEYLYIDGKKVPICNENGCVSDCTKTETEL